MEELKITDENIFFFFSVIASGMRTQRWVANNHLCREEGRLGVNLFSIFWFWSHFWERIPPKDENEREIKSSHCKWYKPLLPWRSNQVSPLYCLIRNLITVINQYIEQLFLNYCTPMNFRFTHFYKFQTNLYYITSYIKFSHVFHKVIFCLDVNFKEVRPCRPIRGLK